MTDDPQQIMKEKGLNPIPFYPLKIPEKNGVPWNSYTYDKNWAQSFLGRPNQPSSTPFVQFPLSDDSCIKNKMKTQKRSRSNDSSRYGKQYVSEEKMAEHMSRLTITSEDAQPTTDTPTIVNQRLYMCQQMRKLQTDSILPHAILRRIPRPCTAVILWQPPPLKISTATAASSTAAGKEKSQKTISMDCDNN